MKASTFKKAYLYSFMFSTIIIMANKFMDDTFVVLVSIGLLAVGGVSAAISFSPKKDKPTCGKSSAQIISDQSAKIAELERGIGDILLQLRYPEHKSIKNDNVMVGAILGTIREMYKEVKE